MGGRDVGVVSMVLTLGVGVGGFLRIYTITLRNFDVPTCSVW